MAERKAGPVKPPVIDLKARPASLSPEASGAAASVPPKAIEAPKAAPPLAAPETPPKAATVRDEVIIAAPPPQSTAPAAATPTKPADSTPPTGAAKPPDAAKAAGGKPNASESPPGAAAAKPPDRAPTAGQGGAIASERQPAMGRWPTILAGAAGGAIIGIAVCYGLAVAGYWPGNSADLARRLDQLQQAAQATDGRLGDLGKRLDTLQSDVTPRLAATESTLAAMAAGLEPLKTAPADLADLGTRVKSLSTRLDAVAAGASSADAGALAANVKTAQQDLATLTQKVDALTTRAGSTATTVATLRTELDGARTAIAKAAAAPSPQAIAAAMQLPILISALDADFAAGRPYANDLKGLTAALPAAAIPASVTASAAAGLPAAADVAAAFEATMPDMIAAEPGAPSGGWQDQLAGWARGVLALRKAGAEPGSGPDALLSQLEAAVARHDFVGAAALLDRLPPPMQQAAGPTAGQIRTLADADTFITGLRQQALAPLEGAPS